MSTRSTIIAIYPIHIYHEWADEGFVYMVNIFGIEPLKLCSLKDWYSLVKFIKENDKDTNGNPILMGEELEKGCGE